jgi:hypothetical protein
MSYKSDQYENAVKFKRNLLDDEENMYIVMIGRKQYRHFFKKTHLNLWENIRKDALDYFAMPIKELSWHINDVENNPKNIPEGDMLSSQVSCVNHLFLLRKNPDYASAILKNINDRIISAEIVCDGYGNDGYIEFESWGTKENNDPLREKENGILNGKPWIRQRGSFSTSIDAVMVGKFKDEKKEKKILIIIEWKYTESYPFGEIIKTSNSKAYNYILNDKEKSPIHQIDDFNDLYYDPFYQMMRQTLWGCRAAKDFGCDEYIHLHIVPKENSKFQEITSPNLKIKGEKMSNVWEKLLKEPFRYNVLPPEKLLSPLKNKQELKGFFDYLETRYLEKYI